MAEVKIMYREKRQNWDGGGERPADSVCIELREWRGDGRSDVVIDTLVIIDHDLVSHTADIVKRDTNANMIRGAIALFDELFEAHPNKDKLQ